MKKKIKISSLVILFIAVILFGNPSSSNASNLYGYICSGDSISCGAVSAIYKIFKDDLNAFYICGEDSTICNSLNAIYRVEKYDLDTYYVCSGNSIACGFLNDVYIVEVDDTDTMYVCPGDSIACGFLNDVYTVDIDDLDTMYVCSGNSIACGLLNDVYRVELINNTSEYNYNNYLCPENSIYQNGTCTCNYGYVIDNIDKNKCIPINQYCQRVYGINSYGLGSKCYCNVGYEFNSNQTVCIKSVICPLNSTKVNNICVCNEGFVFKNGQCITHTQDCRLIFGNYVIGRKGDAGNSFCDCETGYVWNFSQTACIKIETPEKKEETIKLTQEEQIQQNQEEQKEELVGASEVEKQIGNEAQNQAQESQEQKQKQEKKEGIPTFLASIFTTVKNFFYRFFSWF